MALCAGMKPANNPENIKITSALTTTPKLTLGFTNMSTGPTESSTALTPYINAAPKTMPIIPDMIVRKIDRPWCFAQSPTNSDFFCSFFNDN